MEFWKHISFYKYFENKNWTEYFYSGKRFLSHFWKNFFTNVESFLCSTCVKVENGNQTLFWFDKWSSTNTLASLFPALFHIAEFPYASISSLRKKINNEWVWDIKFQRQLTGNLVFQYFDMLKSIMSVNFLHREDKRMWIWEAKGKFTVKSYYHFLTDGGLRYAYINLWKLPVPLKVKFLVWLALRSGLNTKKNLEKKGSQISDCAARLQERRRKKAAANAERVSVPVVGVIDLLE
ncbi:uncharacterized protein LOC109821583 [Asparagus officinalis]|uniref:uncharacterized protein LOC109821583 n=1 Tax=Asparagus officinalis TaxID=4686 RepID=UPI00098E1EE5|nr:uncharacterized protein LOC109821583 [Asparagus officinalis]